jgi:hypothetical protein
MLDIVVDESGVADVSAAFAAAVDSPLTVGDSFIIDATLTVDARADSSLAGGSLTADFLNTGAFFCRPVTPE